MGNINIKTNVNVKLPGSGDRLRDAVRKRRRAVPTNPNTQSITELGRRTEREQKKYSALG